MHFLCFRSSGLGSADLSGGRHRSTGLDYSSLPDFRIARQAALIRDTVRTVAANACREKSRLSSRTVCRGGDLLRVEVAGIVPCPAHLAIGE